MTKRTLVKNNTSLVSNIPAFLIEHFNLKAGDELDFKLEKDHIKVIPVHPAAKQNVQAASPTV